MGGEVNLQGLHGGETTLDAGEMGTRTELRQIS